MFEEQPSSGWFTRVSFYLAILCSSFGLVNIWRFPYIVMENGGGAFFYMYFFCTVILGGCFMVAELIIGKLGKKSLWSSLERMTSDRLALDPDITFFRRVVFFILKRAFIGTLFVQVLLLAYYTAISGWVMSYLVRDAITLFVGQVHWDDLLPLQESAFFQCLFAFIHIGLCVFFIRRGMQKSVERMSLVAAPLFIIIMGILCMLALNLPGTEESLRYLLYPDFTKITKDSFNQAIGHMVLSLGLGLGTMISYGGHFHKNRDVIRVSSRMVIFSLVISAMSLLIICPFVLGATYATFGPKLLFQTLPLLIRQLEGGEWLLVLFYLTLYISSLVVCSSLLSSLVTNNSDRFKWPRIRSAWTCSIAVMGVTIFIILSTTQWRHFRWLNGISLLKSIDGLLVNLLLPLLAVVISLISILVIPQKLVVREFNSKEIHQEIDHFFPMWQTIILWVAPVAVVASLLLRLL